ncbi:unnamed protein product [Cuscuta campestris]|uniref:Uncharacterized protein n=1 Tax=Cuscuta campestris TaxID=132261 RepID=A0A484M7W4_9ASTE|nr:unnamed protein product [Cuscuta campestris]
MLRPADAATKICRHPGHFRNLCASVTRWLFFGLAAAEAVSHHARKNQSSIEANHRRRLYYGLISVAIGLKIYPCHESVMEVHPCGGWKQFIAATLLEANGLCLSRALLTSAITDLNFETLD